VSVVARIRRVLRSDRRDRGMALPTVIGLGLVMLIMVAGSMTAVSGGVFRTKTDENIKAAMAAAYAGVSEYQSRLSNDATYYKFGNPAAPFSASSASVLSLPTGTNANPAFGTNASDGWSNIPDPDTGVNTGASFRYQVDISDYASKGIIRLQSTGRVGKVTATLVADLRQTGFIDFLYFTDFETGDPILNAATKNLVDSSNNSLCARYAWATPTRDDACSNIQFGKFDTLGGPVHSNDTLDVCGATFNGPVTTGDPGSQPGGSNYELDTGCSDGVWNQGKPTSVNVLPMPLTNGAMQLEAISDTPTTVPNPGCMYTGPTTITFVVDGGVGKMRVYSPYTKHTEPTSTGGAGPDPAKCGAISDLQSTSGALIPVLDQNLIFVQGVPAGSGDPNYTAPGTTPAGLTCLTSSQNWTDRVYDSTKRKYVYVTSSYVTGGFKFGSIQYPSNNELIPHSSTTDNPAYSCRAGDLYVSGKLKGHTTLASANYVYATGDITYNDSSSDVLGLVGQNGVWVWNPIVCSKTLGSNGGYNGVDVTCPGSWSYGNSDSTPVISAAILAVAHTFIAQNYDGGTAGLGARDSLTINGAIAQKYRGPVAMASGSTRTSGYAKVYTYDQRFANTAPPKFLTPTSTSYGVTQYSSVSPAYDWNGNPQ
jgi:hypothetical protein